MQAGREIKFRAWDRKQSKMVDMNHLRHHASGFRLLDEDREYEFMQFTGLRDKNGKEIYEGDIVKTHNQNNIVQYEQSSFMLVGLHEDKYERTYAHLRDYLIDITISNIEGSKYDGITIKLEVIGNVYENPELLEVGK
ncbi:YopX family protein [Brevibacillus formosus]|uniref:YopX family protein n=1 Tax=Brevibacillus formosus TaxID=54913 RepID=UPI003F1B8F3D